MDGVPPEAVEAVDDPDTAQEMLAEQPLDALVAPLKEAEAFAEHAKAFIIIGFEETDTGITIHFLNQDGETVYEQDFDDVAEVITLLSDGRLFTTLPMSASEKSRLKAVRDIPVNDLEDEPALKNLTQLAAGVFNVPAAYIGIVDAKQERFLSCFGIDLAPTKREDTICTHTIAQNDVVVVENTAEDPRFSKKGFAEEGIVWYAGAPIHNHGGGPVGTFCLVAEEPRRFTETDRERLKLFADEAWAVFELYTQLRDSKFMAGYIH